MTKYDYQVVSFRATAKSQDAKGAQEVATQLQALVDKYVKDGWEFYSVEQVQMEIRPGCMSALFGARVNVIALDEVIFRREVADAVATPS